MIDEAGLQPNARDRQKRCSNTNHMTTEEPSGRRGILLWIINIHENPTVNYNSRRENPYTAATIYICCIVFMSIDLIGGTKGRIVVYNLKKKCEASFW